MGAQQLVLRGGELVKDQPLLLGPLPTLGLAPGEVLALGPAGHVGRQPLRSLGIAVPALEQVVEADPAPGADPGQLLHPPQGPDEVLQFDTFDGPLHVLVVVPDLEVRMLQGQLDEHLVHLLVVQDELGLLAAQDLVERGLGDEDLALPDQLRHLTEEEGEQEGPDVRAVHVGVGHDDHPAVAELGDVELVTDPALQRGDQRPDLLEAEHLVQPGLLDVQQLPAQGQDRLDAVVATTLGAASRRVALHDEQLGVLALLRAVGELVGHSRGVQGALALDQFTGPPGGLPGLGRQHRAGADLPGVRGVLLQPGSEALGDRVADEPLHLGVDQLLLGLVVELRIGDLDRNDRGESLPQVLPGGRDVLEQVVLAGVPVDDPGERLLEAVEVRAAVGIEDVVAEGEQVLVGGVGVLEGDLRPEADRLVLVGERHHRAHVGLGEVQVSHVPGEPLRVVEGLVPDLAAGIHPLVDQPDGHPGVEVGQLPQPLLEDLVPEAPVREDRLVREEGDLGARDRSRRRVAHHLELAVEVPPREPDRMDPAFLDDLDLGPLGERVDALDPDPVQSAGDLVGVVVELPARMQLGQDDLDRGPSVDLGIRVLHGVQGHAAAVVGHHARPIHPDPDRDHGGVARHHLVDRVVHALVHQVVEPRQAGPADVHPGALADRLQALEDLDVVRGVGPLVLGVGIGLGVGHLGRMFLCSGRPPS